MSKGYLIVAHGKEYVKQAYLCALSIKATQSGVSSVSLITDEGLDEQYIHAFENVIVKDIEDSDTYKTKIRSLIYDLTPYNETVVLDSDMIFVSDVSHWWDLMSQKDLMFATNIKNYRNKLADNSFYRENFKKYNLPESYVAFHYFKKSNLAETFYALVKLISSDERYYYKKILNTGKEISASFDFTCSLVLDMLGIESYAIEKDLPYPTFVHMKGRNQGWIAGVANWMMKLPYFLDDSLNFYVGNYKQNGVFHYSENLFAADDLIKKYKGAIK